jgi:hypothetical protein
MRRLGRIITICSLLIVMASCGGDGAGGPEEFGERALTIPPGEFCSEIRRVTLDPAQHVEEGTKISYRTIPPTSGRHYPRWVTPGTYSDPIPNEIQVHNLEHGHVLVQYRDLSIEEIQRITARVIADPFMMVLAPKPDMDWKLALTSWGKIQICSAVPPDVDEVIRTFVEKNRNKAPESIPR